MDQNSLGGHGVPIPIPAALLNTLMGVFPAQMSPQGHGQQAHSVATIQQMMMPSQQPMQPAHLQLQQGGSSAVLWPGWQTQQWPTSGIQAAQALLPQYQVLPQQQQQQHAGAGPGQLQVQQQGASVEDIVKAVAAALQPLAQEKDATPAGSSANDEQILVDALRDARRNGVTPRQALEKLHTVNNHTEAGWKNFFLDNLERLYDKVYAPRPLYISAPASASSASKVRQHSPSGSGARETGHVQLPRTQSHRSSVIGSTVKCAEAPDKQPHHPSDNAAGGKGAAPERQWRQGTETMLSVHAGVTIPPVEGIRKPRPPRRECRDPDNSKFTDEDLVFFIQYLRWRVRGEGRTPSRTELCEELGEQTPQHTALAWRKHWLEHPELPNRIYSEARARNQAVESAEDGQKTCANKASRNQPSAGARDNHDGDDDQSSDDGQEEDDDQDEEDEQYEPSSGEHDDTSPPSSKDRLDPSAQFEPLPTQQKKKRKARPLGGTNVKISDTDLRDMAKYWFDNRATWKEHHSQASRWEAFTKANPKRSGKAWLAVENYRRNVIEQYFCELVKEHEQNLKQAQAAPKEAAVDASREALGTNSISQKRPTTTRDTEHDSGDPSALKRVKIEDVEYIDLVSD